MIDRVGATIGRPQILPKQNLSPQGENVVIFLGEIRKSPIFGGRAMRAPTEFDRNLPFSFQSRLSR